MKNPLAAFTTKVCIGALLGAVCAAAAAQQGAALEEIVVTASKRGAQDLQSAPITVNAYSGTRLEEMGFDDFEDYANLTPGLDFQKTGPARSQIILRGVTLGRVSTAEPQNRSVVGLYLDDVPIGQNGYNTDPDLFDLERVEVVKGPQGSLFGDSAMAGAIRYVTRTPDLNEFDGRMLVNGSGTRHGGGSYNVKGAVNLPLVQDVLGLRAAAYYRNNAGWIDNPANGHDNINDEETVGGRATLFWQATSDLTAKLTVLAQHMDAGVAPTEEEGAGWAEAGDLSWNHPLDDSFEEDMFLTSLTLNWDLGWGDITNLISYQDREWDNYSRGGMHEIFLFFFGAELPNNTLHDPWKVDRVTEEIRLSTKTGGMFDVTVGLYYSDGDVEYPTFGHGDGFDQFAIDVLGFPDLASVQALGCADFPDHYFCGTQKNSEKQLALFGELYFNLTEQLQLVFGGRWFDYDQTFDESYGGFFNGEPTAGVIDIEEDGFNPKFGINYTVNDDLMLYGSAAKGFRLGGVNDPLPTFCDPELQALGLTAARTYESDTLWSYEGGFKSTLMDGRVTLNGSGYYTKWKDVQTRILLPLCGFLVTQNASAQEIYGGEGELNWLATDNLTLSLGVSYTDSALVGNAPAVSGFDGDRAPYVPKWKVAAFVDYAFPIGTFADGFLSFNVKHTTNYYNTYDRFIEIPDQTVGNLRIGGRRDRYTLSIFADNVWDERIITDADGALHGISRSIGRPRTIGAELGVEF